MKLNYVSRKPNACFSVYRADGEEVTVPLSLANYQALALPGAKEPPRPALPAGKTWVWAYSGEFYRFDTPSGNLRQGDACLDGGKLYVCIKPEGVTAVGFKNGEFTKAGDSISLKESHPEFDVKNNELTIMAKVSK